MFKSNRVTFFIKLYFYKCSIHGRKIPAGSLSNIHELYDNNPDPFFWINTDKSELKKRQERKFSLIKFSNSINCSVIGTSMSGFGNASLVETEGYVVGLNVEGNSMQGFDNATLIDSTGLLEDLKLSGNNIKIRK
ncbi:hypothetical protein [uncultured Shewanella sp.]|uniref:hypothetical protein n=1 Tax=uncultured Shewanella sp. TaxID=173975 RepID=UPI002629F2C9|nr:hypothetical protein [uncultured Shewanella sp.]